MHPSVLRSLVRDPLSERERAILRPHLERASRESAKMHEAIANATQKEWVEVGFNMQLERLFEKLSRLHGGWPTRINRAGTIVRVQYFFPNGASDFMSIVVGFHGVQL